LTERGLTGETATLDVLPDTVHAAVQARLDLLSKQERTVLQVASVASRAIRAPMLREISGDFSFQEIDAALAGLLQRDLLIITGNSAFAFRHILIRDVAYGTLSRSERIRLHSKIAGWLESMTEERLDEYTELIAYHYREAVLLGRQSAVPRPMPTETAQAVHYLERAGELASRTGSFAEAKNYLENAIALAPESDHLRLYEKLGKSLFGGFAVIEAYSKALELWRRSGAADPLIGARLQRQLLTAFAGSRYTTELDQEKLKEQWIEALRLTEQAGDEGEAWRVRLSYISLLRVRGNILPEEVSEILRTSLAAIEYFEKSGDQDSFNDALDTYAVFSWMAGTHKDALAASQRRLAIPGLNINKRSDASTMIASTYFLLGDYDSCIATMQEALKGLRAGEPIEYLGNGISIAMWATYVTGRWFETDTFLKALGETWERLQQSPETAIVLNSGYYIALLIAKAREEKPAMDAASSVLERIYLQNSMVKDVVSAFLDDDLSKLPLDIISDEATGPFLMLFSECGVPAPDQLMEVSSLRDDVSVWCHKIAQALATGNNIQLAGAIDEAEAHHLIVHATRMRVILNATYWGARTTATRPTGARTTPGSPLPPQACANRGEATRRRRKITIHRKCNSIIRQTYMYMVRSKDTPCKEQMCCHSKYAMTTFIKKERRHIHVLGLSRYRAFTTTVVPWPVLLDPAPGSADLGIGTPVQFKKRADAILQARAFLPSWRTANSDFRNGDPPPALRAW
jgi:tetratricopeptide (TPR) repeat protein